MRNQTNRALRLNLRLYCESMRRHHAVLAVAIPTQAIFFDYVYGSASPFDRLFHILGFSALLLGIVGYLLHWQSTGSGEPTEDDREFEGAIPYIMTICVLLILLGLLLRVK